jgi:wyosine [tRNA(Phe)-imidazoG37] synthetase (radical SAM superfamily)
VTNHIAEKQSPVEKPVVVRFDSQPDAAPEYEGLRRWGLFSDLVFGPVVSRRLGRSLGINPFPRGYKICSFDCPYCECGRTTMSMPEMLTAPFPPVDIILAELETVLEEGAAPDAITLAGNGEPTMHPDFAELVDGLVKIRARRAPNAKLAILTNGMFMDRVDIAAAFAYLDVVMLKLDAGTPPTMEAVNLPLGAWSPERVVRAASRLPSSDGKGSRVTIQSLFLEGTIANAAEDEINTWLMILDRIRPAGVVIYTLDRVPPSPGLRAISRERLDQIAEKVRQVGLECEAI